MKVPKMMLDYTLRFGVASALGYIYWDPKSTDEIRLEVEATMKPDLEARKKKQAKFAELLLQTRDKSDESQQQLDQITAFAKTKEQHLADRARAK
ncbi:unnamed protein product [Hyaloperonospora brassicae]|uniref:Uncharacterized protein n=1 Tax=Hyaloperonospora brassicae TaxID=162125 RepID=A0AAV0UHP9_HYABA|nr:unnamed protein product [Hyaloperonospora brassicae]